MKKAIILFIILLTFAGWTAKKLVNRMNKSKEELQRFEDYADGYGRNARIFLVQHAKLHHDEAFEEAYQMWQFTPISEIDLETRYDEEAYYKKLGKILYEKAEASGETDARNALIDMGKYYGVVHTAEKESDESKPLKKRKPNR